MTTFPTPQSGQSSESESNQPFGAAEQSEGIELHEIIVRLRQGLPQTIGLAVLGLAVAAAFFFLASPFNSETTSMRVSFAFSGYANGEYPDHSKFQPDDLRAPEIIVESLKEEGFETTADFAAKIRAAVSIEGLISPSLVKEHDRLRSLGQTPPPYQPDEYLITLTLPRHFPLSSRQRELLLNRIVSVYHEQFQRTYAEIPLAFGNAFQSLRTADFYSYELILNREISGITDYLTQQLDEARTFRSPTTNLSFSDLLKQTDLFSKIRTNELLGLIQQNGLSHDRKKTLVKLNYYLNTLESEEEEALEQEKVVDELLSKSQARSQDYVFGIKSQVAQQRTDTPVVDQGLVDSLLANDAYNFLIRRALDAGFKVKHIQAEKALLLERRKTIEMFMKGGGENQEEIIADVQHSLAEVELSYNELIANIRKTQADFARQHFADAIRVGMEATTESILRTALTASAVGIFVGAAMGMGLSLIGIYIGRK